MKWVERLFQPSMRGPVLALLLSSAVCTALVTARIVLSANLGYAFLVWNLFLAWLPLLFALKVQECHQLGVRRGWRLGALAAGWLLLFPNAPYILTDIIHLKTKFTAHFWVDLILVLSCALTGLVLGFLSLYVMQGIVADRFGRWASWLFIIAVACLSSIGVFIGRFLRLNSWDIVRPGKFYERMGHWTTVPSADASVFPVLFALFFLMVYLMFYGLTRLPQSDTAKS